MRIPSTPATEVDTGDDGLIEITQDQQGEAAIVYFAPEIALVIAREVTKQALAAIHARGDTDEPAE